MRVNFKGACVGGFKRIGHVRLIALLDFVYAAFFLSPPTLSLLIPAPRPRPRSLGLCKIQGPQGLQVPCLKSIGRLKPARMELELIQTQMAQKPMLRAEVGMRVRCANKASAE